MKTRLLYALALVSAAGHAATARAEREDQLRRHQQDQRPKGMQRSQVMELNSWLSDVYAPRVTGSPTIEKAAQWVMGKLKEWGLVNIKMEPWPNSSGFERGWTNDKFYLAAVTPERFCDSGNADRVDAGHERPCDGRGRACHGDDRRGAGAVQGEAEGQVGDDAGRARCRGVLGGARERATRPSSWRQWKGRRPRRSSASRRRWRGPRGGSTPAPGGPGAPAAAQQAQPPQGQRAAGPPAAAGQPQPPGPGGGRGGAANVRNDFFTG